jgi:hypothetical protein
VCAGAGALFIGAEAFAAVLAASGDDPLPADPVQWSAAVWGAGYSVVYEPDAAAVRCAEPHTTARSDTSFVWPTAARRPARGPDSGGESFWRLVLATDDVRGSCGIEAPAGELQVAG